MPPFAAVERALDELRAGRFVVVVSGESAEDENLGEGNLTIAAQFVTPDTVNFMATHGRGLICLCLTHERCEALGLRPMASTDGSSSDMEFTVSIEARDGITTGISAPDRARTIQVATDPSSTARDIVQPGHVFPLRAQPGGVLRRQSKAEAAVDLARLAGLSAAGVVCHVMNEDGTTAGVPDLVRFCEQHGLALVRVVDLIAYRRRREHLVEREVEVRLPTELGSFSAVAYRDTATGAEHVALVKGDVEGAEEVPLHVHRECIPGDVFRSSRCGCAQRLESAMRAIEQAGQGIVLYLTNDRSPSAEATGVTCGRLGSVDVELRYPGVTSQILADLGVDSTHDIIFPKAAPGRPLQDSGKSRGALLERTLLASNE